MKTQASGSRLIFLFPLITNKLKRKIIKWQLKSHKLYVTHHHMKKIPMHKLKTIQIKCPPLILPTPFSLSAV